MTDVLETKNYEIFKFNFANAELKSEHIDRLKASIMIKNMLHLRPILVNAKMEIIDGQHRFMAAKSLGLSIFYKIEADLAEDDMVLLNSNSRVWSMRDYVHHYKNRGKKDYEMLDEFCKKHNIKLISALYVFSRQGGKSNLSLKSGSYKFPSKEEVFEVEKSISMFETIKNVVKSQSLKRLTFLDGSGFFKGTLSLFSHENFSLDMFLKKLSLHIDKIDKRADPTGYYIMLKDIYNWKNHDPLI